MDKLCSLGHTEGSHRGAGSWEQVSVLQGPWWMAGPCMVWSPRWLGLPALGQGPGLSERGMGWRSESYGLPVLLV